MIDVRCAPDGLAKLDAVLCEQLGGHAAQSSEHGPPGVDDLDLAIPADTKPLTFAFAFITVAQQTAM